MRVERRLEIIYSVEKENKEVSGHVEAALKSRHSKPGDKGVYASRTTIEKTCLKKPKKKN